MPIARIPQLKRCGLIEASVASTLVTREHPIPQLKRCGLIEAAVRAAALLRPVAGFRS